MEIKEQIVLEKSSGFNDYSISDKRLYDNISKYNMYYDWVVFFYDSLYEQIKEDEDDTEFNYFYENFLEDKERHIKYALDFLKRIK
jgi:peptide methionine sulfoxide reductase MsrB